MKIQTANGNLRTELFPCKNRDLMKNLKKLEQFARANGYRDGGVMRYGMYIPF